VPEDQPKPTEVSGVSLPLQGRSWETYHRILDAAESLLRDQDMSSISMETLLAEAGVTVGSFYARFEGKEALYGALVDRYREDIEAFVSRPTETGAGDLEEACRALVATYVRRIRKRRGLLRFLVGHYRTRTERSPLLRGLSERVNDWFVQVLMPFRDEIGHRDPRQAIRNGTYFMAAICRDRILFGESPHSLSVSLPASRFEEELTAMLVSYLRRD
jgi:AcrR family transcriptional regulator